MIQLDRCGSSLVGILAAVFACGGCGAQSEGGEEVGSSADSIQGGQAESGYPAVGKLSTPSSYCTAELIAPSIVLTAGHCLGSTMNFRTGTDSSNFVSHYTDTQIKHPSKDLLLVHLSSAITTISPLAINTGALPAVGSTCKAVGFGRHDDPDGTAGTKRSANETVESANSTTIKVVMDTGIADHGDSGGPLLCGSGSKVAAVVHNHSDGDWPTHIRENYATIDSAWINANLALAPVPVSNSLYIQQSAGLWRADDGIGNYSGISSANWQDATSITNLGGYLYVVQNSHLHQVDPSTGSFTVLGRADWGGSTTMAASGSNLYITQDASLWKITSLTTGAYSKLGTGNWSGATSMVALGGWLYIVQNSRLHRVDPGTGSYTVLGGVDWAGSTTMAASGSNLYITQDGSLWKITNLTTGAFSKLGTADWTGATSMTALNGNLYIIQANYLTKVNPSNGSYELLGSADWGGSTVMTALP